MSVDEDPLRLIFAYCSHIKVPTWVADKAQTNCKSCNTKLAAGERHHCRLDGFLYCSQCTGKYHVPLQFNINSEKKSGPVRVCFGCKEECFQSRLKEQSLNIAKAKSSPSFKPEDEQKLTLVKSLPNHSVKDKEISPPTHWVESRSANDECSKCHEKGKQHNCRTCGLLHCSKCTSKMNIPSYFEKKAKTGPMRVCDECRYKITVGYKTVERLSSAVKEEEDAQSAANAGFVTSSANKTCTIVGCRDKVVTSTGLCATHAASATNLRTEQVNPTATTIAIYWEGKLSAAIAKISATPTTTLKEMDNLFKKSSTVATTESYHYILKGDPIPESFWDMFNIGKLGQQLIIRKKAQSSLLNSQLLESVQTIQPANFGPNDKNPFKRSDNETAMAEKTRLAEEAKKPKFHKPTAVKFTKPQNTGGNLAYTPIQKGGSGGKGGNLALNNIATGSPISIDAPIQQRPGQSLDDLLKQRAKAIFGQTATTVQK